MSASATRRINGLFLALCLALVPLSLTAIAVASQPGAAQAQVRSLLRTGKLHQVVTTPAFWQRFPGVGVEARLLIEPLLLMVMAALLAGTGAALAGGGRFRQLGAPVWLLCGLAPYAVGVWYLHGPLSEDRIGSWLQVMLLGLLYAAVAAGLAAIFSMLLARHNTSPRR